jgi:hypothetical protein
MGTVVTFPPPRRKRASAASTTSEATILLFMGVRYVRELDETAAADVPPPMMHDPSAGCPPLETV